jgi:hypothetical protein
VQTSKPTTPPTTPGWSRTSAAWLSSRPSPRRTSTVQSLSGGSTHGNCFVQTEPFLRSLRMGRPSSRLNLSVSDLCHVFTVRIRYLTALLNTNLIATVPVLLVSLSKIQHMIGRYWAEQKKSLKDAKELEQRNFMDTVQFSLCSLDECVPCLPACLLSLSLCLSVACV